MIERYGDPTETEAVLVTPEEIFAKMAGKGPTAAEEVEGRHGGTFTTFGDYSILSFNGNKIITTSGGGLLTSNNEDYIQRANFLATQAKSRDHNFYWHTEIGYNYAMSNISAGVGLGQLELYDTILSNKKKINDFYRKALIETGIFEMLLDTPESKSNHWLNAVLFKKELADRIDLNDLLQFFTQKNIEIRRFWTPLHIQPAYEHFPSVTQGVGEDIFNRGICLPSGANLSENQQTRIIATLKTYLSNKGIVK